jgi:putative ATPase
MSLFASQAPSPLAERMRPRRLEDFLGQEDLLAEGKPFRRMLDSGRLHSMILWGPPGVGKTTLARLMASMVDAEFATLSAVTSGIKEVREIIEQAKSLRARAGRRTLLFVDEIHRFNKSQQDAFLPHVESGDILLVGATTENPSFEVISPLLSRVKVYVLKALSEEQIKSLLLRALTEDSVLRREGTTPSLHEDAAKFIAAYAGGDARAAYNLLEASVESLPKDSRHIELAHAQDTAQRKALLYDKAGEEHYNIISALHKSVRNSDPDAALYWLARMLEAGEDPLYIARRMVRAASEDVGLADPQALAVALNAKDAVDFLGMPECSNALAEAVVYLALAPKSNALYKGYGRAARDVHEKPCPPVPLHLRNAPTRLMKDLEYGKGYRYAHDEAEGVASMECLPPELKGARYYEPTERGIEVRLKARMAEILKIRKVSQKPTAKKD